MYYTSFFLQIKKTMLNGLRLFSILAFLCLSFSYELQADNLIGVKYDNINRQLVLSPKDTIKYKLFRKDRSVVLILETLQSVDVEKLKVHLSDGVKFENLKRVIAKKITLLSFKVSKELAVNHFKDKNKIILAFIKADSLPKKDEQPPQVKNDNIPKANPGELQIGINEIDIFQSEKAYEVHFPWKKSVNAVAFRRGGYFWIGFDRYTNLDTTPLLKLPFFKMKHPFQVNDKRLTLLKLPLPDNVNPSIRKEGNFWIFKFQKQPFRPTNELIYSLKSDQRKRLYFEVPVSSSMKVIDVFDAEIGDRLFLGFIKSPATGILNHIRYVEFEVLPSLQGIVVKPLHEEVWAGWKQNNFAIKSKAGLISAELDNLQIQKTEDLTSLLKIETWKKGGVEKYVENQYKFYRQLGYKTEEDLNELRYDMAKFYFAFEIPEKSIALLQLIARDRSPIVDKPAYIAIYGASMMYSRKYEEATRIFFDGRLDHYPEINFWRGASLAARQEWTKAAKFFFPFKQTLSDDYPKNLVFQFYLLALETSLALGKQEEAKKILKAFPKGLRPDQKRQRSYLQATLLWVQGKGDEAREIWKELEKSQNIPLRAKATLAWVESAYIDKVINEEQAIDYFERLRFIYRSSKIEYTALRRLAELYLKQNQPIKSMKTIQSTIRNYPEKSKEDQLEQEMRNTFVKFLINDEMDTSSTLKTIAMYEEFKQFTPKGKQGDIILQKLAQRFVDLDLLQNGIDVLNNLIANRLVGEDRAQAKLKLSVIQMDNYQIPEAIKTLDSIDDSQLGSDTIRKQKKWLLAQAYTDLGQHDKALSFVEGDLSEQAALIKTEIYWTQKNWNKVIGLFEKLTEQSHIEGDLTEKQAKYLLNLATAYALGQKKSDLKILKHDFGDKMKKTKYSKLFDIVTDSNATFTNLLQQEAQQIALSELYGSFMKSYKENWLK